MGSCPVGELSWWRVVLVGTCPGRSCPGWGFVLVGICPVGELSWWGVVLVGTCPGGE